MAEPQTRANRGILVLGKHVEAARQSRATSFEGCALLWSTAASTLALFGSAASPSGLYVPCPAALRTGRVVPYTPAASTLGTLIPGIPALLARRVATRFSCLSCLLRPLLPFLAHLSPLVAFASPLVGSIAREEKGLNKASASATSDNYKLRLSQHKRQTGYKAEHEISI